MGAPSKSSTRPEKTNAELLTLINQRHEDWWPEQFHLIIARSAEHDWTAIVDFGMRRDFAHSIGRIVSELRLRYAWVGR